MRVFVTGAAAGLMQGVAVALARDGNDVAFTYRTGGTPPERTVELVRDAGSEAIAYGIDFLADEATVEQSLERIVNERGGFDALVHGVGPMTIARFERSCLRDYHAMIDGNLRSAVQAAFAVLPGMRERGFGRLIFFGINGSQTTQPARGLSLHVAAKAGVVAFARTLALEEGRYGITVNVVEPGDIRDKTLSRAVARERSAANPRGRPGTYEDVADAVRFLMAPENDFINGAVINVTGGLIDAHERNAISP
ncbi:MAG TPA: SDR family oxidoreductase [Candidatus Baltobacteraceae bacterium]|jgi:3-oxoacyl-[acyl-carrier protein] reductase